MNEKLKKIKEFVKEHAETIVVSAWLGGVAFCVGDIYGRHKQSAMDKTAYELGMAIYDYLKDPNTEVSTF